MVLSQDPLAIIVPVLLKATDVILSVCPDPFIISGLVSMFHKLIELSLEPLAKIVPLLLKATEVTALELLYTFPSYFLVSIFHNSIVLL